jgi:hypothetical protein
MNYRVENPRGQQRDKIYREALRLELADMSEGIDLTKPREIARTHIEKAAAGNMQPSRNWLTGWMASRRRSSSTAAPTASLIKIVREIVHMPPPDEIKCISRNSI